MNCVSLPIQNRKCTHWPLYLVYFPNTRLDPLFAFKYSLRLRDATAVLPAHSSFPFHQIPRSFIGLRSGDHGSHLIELTVMLMSLRWFELCDMAGSSQMDMINSNAQLVWRSPKGGSHSQPELLIQSRMVPCFHVISTKLWLYLLKAAAEIGTY